MNNDDKKYVGGHQVWFQNQRAKMKKMQRRGKVDKDGKKTKDGEKSKSSDGKESFEGNPGVNFINIKRANFSYEMSFRQLFSSYMYVKNDVRMKNLYV